MDYLQKQFSILNQNLMQQEREEENYLMSKYGPATPPTQSVLIDFEYRNKQTINDLWEFILNKDLPKYSLYRKIAEMHKLGRIKLSFGDLMLISDKLRYKFKWVSNKAKELGITKKY
jgi:hypothetical protein